MRHLLPAHSAAATAVHCCHDHSPLKERSIAARAAQDTVK